eukprot:CFRG3573T1
MSDESDENDGEGQMSITSANDSYKSSVHDSCTSAPAITGLLSSHNDLSKIPEFPRKRRSPMRLIIREPVNMDVDTPTSFISGVRRDPLSPRNHAVSRFGSNNILTPTMGTRDYSREASGGTQRRNMSPSPVSSSEVSNIGKRARKKRNSNTKRKVIKRERTLKCECSKRLKRQSSADEPQKATVSKEVAHEYIVSPSKSDHSITSTGTNDVAKNNNITAEANGNFDDSRVLDATCAPSIITLNSKKERAGENRREMFKIKPKALPASMPFYEECSPMNDEELVEDLGRAADVANGEEAGDFPVRKHRSSESDSAPDFGGGDTRKESTTEGFKVPAPVAPKLKSTSTIESLAKVTESDTNAPVAATTVSSSRTDSNNVTDLAKSKSSGLVSSTMSAVPKIAFGAELPKKIPDTALAPPKSTSELGINTNTPKFSFGSGGGGFGDINKKDEKESGTSVVSSTGTTPAAIPSAVGFSSSELPGFNTSTSARSASTANATTSGISFGGSDASKTPSITSDSSTAKVLEDKERTENAQPNFSFRSAPAPKHDGDTTTTTSSTFGGSDASKISKTSELSTKLPVPSFGLETSSATGADRTSSLFSFGENKSAVAPKTNLSFPGSTVTAKPKLDTTTSSHSTTTPSFSFGSGLKANSTTASSKPAFAGFGVKPAASSTEIAPSAFKGFGVGSTSVLSATPAATSSTENTSSAFKGFSDSGGGESKAESAAPDTTTPKAVSPFSFGTGATSSGDAASFPTTVPALSSTTATSSASGAFAFGTGAPSTGAPSTAFGGTVPTATTFGGTASSKVALDGKSTTTTTFGGTTPATTIFGEKKPASTTFGEKKPASTTFGGTTPAVATFGATTPATASFSGTNPTSTSFGGAALTTTTFGGAAPTATTFGETAPAATTFGGTAPTSTTTSTTTPKFGGFGSSATGTATPFSGFSGSTTSPSGYSPSVQPNGFQFGATQGPASSINGFSATSPAGASSVVATPFAFSGAPPASTQGVSGSSFGAVGNTVTGVSSEGTFGAASSPASSGFAFGGPSKTNTPFSFGASKDGATGQFSFGAASSSQNGSHPPAQGVFSFSADGGGGAPPPATGTASFAATGPSYSTGGDIPVRRHMAKPRRKRPV